MVVFGGITVNIQHVVWVFESNEYLSIRETQTEEVVHCMD